MSEPYKVVLLGEADVGKLAIIAQITSGKFDPDNELKITAQFIRKTFYYPNEKSVTLDLWDTAGQEKYRSLSKIFHKDAKAIILVYDVTNERSFNELKNYWYESIKKDLDEEKILVVAANKSDLYENYKVSNEMGEEFAKSVGAAFFATSAKNDSGIQRMFDYIGQKILDPNFDFYEEERKRKEEYKEKKQKNDVSLSLSLEEKEKDKKCIIY